MDLTIEVNTKYRIGISSSSELLSELLEEEVSSSLMRCGRSRGRRRVALELAEEDEKCEDTTTLKDELDIYICHFNGQNLDSYPFSFIRPTGNNFDHLFRRSDIVGHFL